MKQIELTQGKVALVSDHQFERASQFNWHALKGWTGIYYAVRNGKRTPSGREPQVYLHRWLMGVTDPKVEVDHIDGDGLNCQDENMRVCTHAENMFNRGKQKNNTTGYKGVSLGKSGKFQAYIKVNKVMKHLGFYDDIITAARVYDDAAKKYHGRFASLNFAEG